MSPIESRLPASATALAFALVSALLAAVTMGVLETRLLDEGAYVMGVGIAAVVGFLVAHFSRRRGALAIVVAGLLVGMAIQAILLVRLPGKRAYYTEWGSSNDAFSWILYGALLAALPAMAAAFVFFVGIQMSRTKGRPAPKDTPERVLVPIAGAAGLLAGSFVARAHASELVVALIVMGIACAALVQVVRVDRARIRWLRDVFDDRDPAFGLVQLEEAAAPDLPLVVGGLVPATVVTHVSELATYRTSSSVRYGVAAFTFEETVRPLGRRIRVALVLAGAAPVSAMIAAFAR